MTTNPTKVLVVCAWPLGGIRTYLGSVFRNFPPGEFELTILARETQERAALESDLRHTGIVLNWVSTRINSRPDFLSFSWHVALALSRNSYNLINSQGFISGICASYANIFSRLPHILTMHGILEDRYYRGRLAILRRMLFLGALHNVTVFLLGVGHDILSNVQGSIGGPVAKRARWCVIPNGIDTARVEVSDDSARRSIRMELGIDDSSLIYGLLGRFMPQKGFDLIIKAVKIISDSIRPGDRKPMIVAVGSGDFERETRSEVRDPGLSDFFRFSPSRRHSKLDCRLRRGSDAFPLGSLQPACSGMPLCRSSLDSLELPGAPRSDFGDSHPGHTARARPCSGGSAMQKVGADPISIRKRALHYRLKAVERFDVRATASQLMSLFHSVAKPDR